VLCNRRNITRLRRGPSLLTSKAKGGESPNGGLVTETTLESGTLLYEERAWL
jgi:hypothetical protein